MCDSLISLSSISVYLRVTQSAGSIMLKMLEEVQSFDCSKQVILFIFVIFFIKALKSL